MPSKFREVIGIVRAQVVGGSCILVQIIFNPVGSSHFKRQSTVLVGIQNSQVESSSLLQQMWILNSRHRL